ncbi:MAG TPA: glycoside hydrolase family 16 protein [Bacteroidia bacterium]|jgi:beta-glucanase (GH16 family)|nr:glycoside hydrolase family 16 protein [Bacteroidia bacterium]
MKKLILIFLTAVSFPFQSQTLWQINKDTVITYHYLDGDEFSANELSKDKWGSWYGWARSIYSNKEQQYYSDYKNDKIKNGNLYITTKKEDFEARFVDWMGDNDSIKSGKGVFQGLNKRKWEYASGLIHSKKSFLKGYFEIKFKAPADKGLWPAFWLYGGSPNEEIDIMELKGEREDQIHIDTHCQKCDMVRNPIGKKVSFGGWIKLNGNLTTGYNVVSGLWDDDEVRYYLNGKCIAISKVKFNKPKSLVANVAVADDHGPFHPGPNKEQKEFSPYIIDYIRVWTKAPSDSKLVLKREETNVMPDNTTSKHTPKVLYGKKSDHINDGIFVSLLNNEDGTLQLFCNGLNKTENYTIKVTQSEKTLFEKTTDSRELNIPVTVSSGVKVEVIYKNKMASKLF